MNNLLSSMLNSAPTASRFADEARASTARAQSAKAEMSGQFSQLLRGYDKPPETPKPAATATPAAPPKPEGKTELQRQEARSAASKKSADPQAKAAEKRPTDPATAAATSASASASARSEQGTAEASEASDGARADETTVAETAGPENANVAALVAPLPAPLPLPIPLPVPEPVAQASTLVSTGMPGLAGLTGLTGTAKLPPGEGAETAVGAEPDDLKTSTSADISPGAGAGANPTAHTPLSRVAQAAAEDAKTKATDSAGAHSGTDFATTLADAVQSQPAALRGADAGSRAHIDAAALGGIANAGASAATTHTSLLPTSAGAASPVRVDVASPLHGAGFAPEMAARLSVLAADGVQTAQLHLNPADMGPVAVQIVLERAAGADRISGRPGQHTGGAGAKPARPRGSAA